MAKSKRGSDENLFSVSGASEALGRARRTITRALSGIKPDAVRHGLSLWKMQTVIRAVNERTEAPLLTTARNPGLTGSAAATEQAFQRYDAAYDAMVKLKTVAARRGAAHKTEPLAREALELMRERDTQNGLHPEHIELKSAKVLQLMTLGLQEPCSWSSSQAWACYNPSSDEQDTR
jgi:hypothetical protein